MQFVIRIPHFEAYYRVLNNLNTPYYYHYYFKYKN